MAYVTCDLGVSADGYVAGPGQSMELPLGDGGEQLHRWMFETPEENAEELALITDAGAFIMGRNMFGPGRDDWDLDWTGWWGDDPPYHAPVFVLTNHEREPIALQGGTSFHFVTGGIEVALQLASAATGERSIAIAGGASTVNQYLSAGLINELRLHIAPVTLGAGERVFDGVQPLDLEQVSSCASSLVTHITYRVRNPHGDH